MHHTAIPATFARKTQPESAMQRDEPQKGAKEAFILRFLCLFAAFTIKCGFTLAGNSCYPRSVDRGLCENAAPRHCSDLCHEKAAGI
jgi:hypothetical protein